jgi:hypothetical protein
VCVFNERREEKRKAMLNDNGLGCSMNKKRKNEALRREEKERKEDSARVDR